MLCREEDDSSPEFCTGVMHRHNICCNITGDLFVHPQTLMSVNRIQTIATLMPRARTLPGAIHASATLGFRETEGAAQVCNVDLKCKWPHLRINTLRF